MLFVLEWFYFEKNLLEEVPVIVNTKMCVLLKFFLWSNAELVLLFDHKRENFLQHSIQHQTVSNARPVEYSVLLHFGT